jgi:hypothetical protein
MDGLVIELLNLVQKELGFEYILVPSADGKYGSQEENGSWSGQIGLLQRKELDLSIMDLTVTASREKV